MLDGKIVESTLNEWMLSETRFRGLWKSQCIQKDETFKVGWSCTFVYKGEFCETECCANPLQAINLAVGQLAKSGETG